MTEQAQQTPSAASSNVLDQAIARVRVTDPALAATLAREVSALRDTRSFGLVFEKHQPESVRLLDYPIKVGVRVAMRVPAKGEEGMTWRVAKVTGRGAQRSALLDDGSVATAGELVVVRDFGEPIYPGLASRRRIQNGPVEAPWHTVISGENYHALQLLRYTHRGKVDLIYIDPPYNTGNEGWIYNDRYVAKNDAYKHSKWLSFMERRLSVARDLLKDTGVIIVAIGDDEHHRLRMLMDQIFGPQNFISDVVWQGVRKNDSRYVSNSADYMLIYARDESVLKDRETRWRQYKPGLEEVLAAGADAWERSDHDATEATRLLKRWFTTRRGEFTASLTNYSNIDDQGRIYYGDNLRSPNPRENLQYDLLHPITGKPTRRPPNGWVYSKETMQEKIAQGRIIFGPDHTTLAYYKRYLDEQGSEVPLNVFEQARRSASERLEQILGDKRFPSPKDHEVLARWIRLIAPRDAVVLDFFGGSGTTTEAVMSLNHEDGGTRQSILVTNNEVSSKDAKALAKDGYVPGDVEWEAKGVSRYVTEPRLATIVTGERSTDWGLDGSTYSEGLAANVEFFDLAYLDPDRVTLDREFAAVDPLLWLKAGGVGDRIGATPADGWAITDRYAVLTDVDEAEPFLATLTELEEHPASIFVVTDSDSDFEAIAGRLAQIAPTAAVSRLYESYLRNFEINTEGA